LARTPERYEDLQSAEELDYLLAEIFHSHVKMVSGDRSYQRRVLSTLSLPQRIWDSWPIFETLTLDGTVEPSSLLDLQRAARIALVWTSDDRLSEETLQLCDYHRYDVDMVISALQLVEIHTGLLSQWELADVPVVSTETVVQVFELARKRSLFERDGFLFVRAGLLDDDVFARYLPCIDSPSDILAVVNVGNPVVRWLAEIFGTPLHVGAFVSGRFFETTPVESVDTAVRRILRTCQHFVVSDGRISAATHGLS
jgi:hypothetical protein